MKKCQQLGILAVLALVMLLVLSGCGGSSSSSPPKGGDPLPLDPDEERIPEEYRSGEPAPLAAEYESSRDTSDGQALVLELSDGSRLDIQEQTGPYEATLERLNADTDLIATLEIIREESGLVPTGSARSLSISGNGNPAGLRPVITFPAHEAGNINPETINVLRLGGLQVGGEWVPDHATLLPTTLDDDGNLRFVDPLLPDGVTDPGGSEVQGQGLPMLSSVSAENNEYVWVGSVRYLLMSFQDDLNWRRSPRLVRMLPDGSGEAEGFRRPASEEELAELIERPICNMVLLVHGHNEEEKEGIYDTSAPSPWLFRYKRMVWDIFYEQALSDDWDFPHECTAFYEFVYPTYRPIFSPVSDKTGRQHETLGESLGRLISEELENNPQLASIMDNDMPLNVMVAAHSQGGLVARAGFHHMPREFRERIERFVSWGTPHQGASLYTMRYALQAGYDLVIDGIRLPLQNISHNHFGGRYVERKLNDMALDTPGIRDLRWSNSKRDKLTILNSGEPFPEITAANVDNIQPGLFSENLATFNRQTYQEQSEVFIPYTFIHGTTPKRASFELVDLGGWWAMVRAKQVHRFAGGTGIEKGATLHELVMQGGYRVSDGAVPVYSQLGQDTLLTIEPVLKVDVDHEEFYGAEPEQRDASSIYRGALTAGRTFSEFRIEHDSRKCPEIELDDNPEDGLKVLTGRLYHPLYVENLQPPGAAIERIEARAEDVYGAQIHSLEFSHSEDGTFSATGHTGDHENYAVVVILRDGSKLVAEARATTNDDDERATVPFSFTTSYGILPPRLSPSTAFDFLTEKTVSIAGTVTVNSNYADKIQVVFFERQDHPASSFQFIIEIQYPWDAYLGQAATFPDVDALIYDVDLNVDITIAPTSGSYVSSVAFNDGDATWTWNVEPQEADFRIVGNPVAVAGSGGSYRLQLPEFRGNLVVDQKVQVSKTRSYVIDWSGETSLRNWSGERDAGDRFLITIDRIQY